MYKLFRNENELKEAKDTDMALGSMIIECGKLVSGDVENFIRNFCFKHKLELSLDITKGWFFNTLRVRIGGPLKLINLFKQTVEYMEEEGRI